jgi:hypothetical protein
MYLREALDYFATPGNAVGHAFYQAIQRSDEGTYLKWLDALADALRQDLPRRRQWADLLGGVVAADLAIEMESERRDFKQLRMEWEERREEAAKAGAEAAFTVLGLGTLDLGGGPPVPWSGGSASTGGTTWNAVKAWLAAKSAAIAFGTALGALLAVLAGREGCRADDPSVAAQPLPPVHRQAQLPAGGGGAPPDPERDVAPALEELLRAVPVAMFDPFGPEDDPSRIWCTLADGSGRCFDGRASCEDSRKILNSFRPDRASECVGNTQPWGSLGNLVVGDLTPGPLIQNSGREPVSVREQYVPLSNSGQGILLVGGVEPFIETEAGSVVSQPLFPGVPPMSGDGASPLRTGSFGLQGHQSILLMGRASLAAVVVPAEDPEARVLRLVATGQRGGRVVDELVGPIPLPYSVE